MLLNNNISTWLYLDESYWLLNNLSLPNNINFGNWKLIINWAEVFTCNIWTCVPYYNNWNYIIFVDRFIYKQFWVKKLSPYSTIRIYNLSTNIFKDYPIFEYKWEKLNIVWINFLN